LAAKIALIQMSSREDLNAKAHRRAELIKHRYSRRCRCLSDEEAWELELLTLELCWYVANERFSFHDLLKQELQ
jgi:hypothetical protein